MLKNLKSKTLAVTLLPLVMLGSANAAVDTAVTTAISDAKADGITVASGIFLVILAIAVWRHLRGAK